MKQPWQWAVGCPLSWPPLKATKILESVQSQQVILRPFSDKPFDMKHFLKYKPWNLLIVYKLWTKIQNKQISRCVLHNSSSNPSKNYFQHAVVKYLVLTAVPSKKYCNSQNIKYFKECFRVTWSCKASITLYKICKDNWVDDKLPGVGMINLK